MANGYEPGGGQPALWAATAHLAELLNTVDATNTRAMFYVGINVASNSLFVAVMASLKQPWPAAIAPILLTLITVAFGLRSLWLRRLPQFPDPSLLKDGEGLGVKDDRVAWAIVVAIANTCDDIQMELTRVSRLSRVLAILTAVQIITASATGLALVV